VDFARDFPVCRATVTYPADGYAAIFGWTQLVRTTDTATGGFEMDPIASTCSGPVTPSGHSTLGFSIPDPSNTRSFPREGGGAVLAVGATG
jgi:hypothetical protein